MMRMSEALWLLSFQQQKSRDLIKDMAQVAGYEIPPLFSPATVLNEWPLLNATAKCPLCASDGRVYGLLGHLTKKSWFGINHCLSLQEVARWVETLERDSTLPSPEKVSTL